MIILNILIYVTKGEWITIDPATKIDRRNLRTKNLLINALTDLIKVKEFNKITIKDITTEAGLNRGTFYIHFQDKEELLNTMIKKKMVGLSKTLSKIKKKIGESTEWEIQHLMVPLFCYLKDHDTFFKILLKENKIKGFYELMYNRLNDFYLTIFSLSDAINQSSTKKQIYIGLVTSGTLGIIIHWIKEDMVQSPVYLSNKLMKIIYTNSNKLILQYSNLPILQQTGTTETLLDRRKIRTEDAFKRSLISLMLEKDYHSITITDITDRAYYNRVTFYSHFKDKDDLYQQIVKEHISNLINTMKNPSQYLKDTSLINLSPTPLVAFFSYIYENNSIFRVMYSKRKIKGFFGQLYQELDEYFYNEFVRNYEESSEELKLYSSYITNGLLNSVGIWFASNIKYSPLYLAEFFTQVLNESANFLKIQSK